VERSGEERIGEERRILKPFSKLKCGKFWQPLYRPEIITLNGMVMQ